MNFGRKHTPDNSTRIIPTWRGRGGGTKQFYAEIKIFNLSMNEIMRNMHFICQCDLWHYPATMKMQRNLNFYDFSLTRFAIQ